MGRKEIIRTLPISFFFSAKSSCHMLLRWWGHICDHRQGRGVVSHAPAAVNSALLLRITAVDFPQEGAGMAWTPPKSL
jgi:hypothetical protein